jgi:hypothetical protein
MMTRKLAGMLLLAVLVIGMTAGLTLPDASVQAGGIYVGTTTAPLAAPNLQAETPTPGTGTTVPTEGAEDTLPWWLLALPLLALVVAGLFVWRRPAMERPQTANPIAPATTGTGTQPITERRPDTEESERFEERD